MAVCGQCGSGFPSKRHKRLCLDPKAAAREARRGLPRRDDTGNEWRDMQRVLDAHAKKIDDIERTLYALMKQVIGAVPSRSVEGDE